MPSIPGVLASVMVFDRENVPRDRSLPLAMVIDTVFGFTPMGVVFADLLAKRESPPPPAVKAHVLAPSPPTGDSTTANVSGTAAGVP